MDVPYTRDPNTNRNHRVDKVRGEKRNEAKTIIRAVFCCLSDRILVFCTNCECVGLNAFQTVGVQLL